LEENGLAEVQRIPTEPFHSFEQRFAEAASRRPFDLIFVSQVFFDSGFRIRDLATIVNAVREPESFVVIDGYHGFMAVPTDFAALADRAFYLAGGYKYAMAGEGGCFLHCPPGYGARPRDTGWYAGFSTLEHGAAGVPFATDGSRFLGATFDVSGLYRFNAVQDWLAQQGWTVEAMLAHVRDIERGFLAEIDAALGPIHSSNILIPDEDRRGRFLAFRTSDAASIAQALASKNVIVDHRGDRLRIGFGIYHEREDAGRLARALADQTPIADSNAATSGSSVSNT
jgi:selenocysteine lyase/cysteine desulfurase